MKLTKWYPANVNPVRVGIYQQKSFDGKDVGYQHWNGIHWGGFGRSIKSAVALKDVFAFSTGWRGLAKKP